MTDIVNIINIVNIDIDDKDEIMKVINTYTPGKILKTGLQTKNVNLIIDIIRIIARYTTFKKFIDFIIEINDNNIINQLLKYCVARNINIKICHIRKALIIRDIDLLKIIINLYCIKHNMDNNNINSIIKDVITINDAEIIQLILQQHKKCNSTISYEAFTIILEHNDVNIINIMFDIFNEMHIQHVILA